MLEGDYEPMLPQGLWRPWRSAEGDPQPQRVRPDRPQPLWRPADGAVAIPALESEEVGWRYVLVSRDDAPWVLGTNWYVSKAGYAVRNVIVAGKRVQQYMHRVVRCTADGLDITKVSPKTLVDHINIRPLDCRRVNLRWSDANRNQQNIGRAHPGVSWDEYRGMWRARLHWQGKDIHVCHCPSKGAAIRQREKRARELGIPLRGGEVQEPEVAHAG